MSSANTMNNDIAICQRLGFLFFLYIGYALTLCGCNPQGNLTAAVASGSSENKHAILQLCSGHNECEEGFICQGGACVKGDCVADYGPDECGINASVEQKLRCCKPWQLCNELNTCVTNPTSPISSQCENDSQCIKAGQFCSAGACYEAAGRSICSASFQCEGDEKCDLRAHLCVPDKGGCQYCAQFPELCCEVGFMCNPQTDHCIRQAAERCTEENVQEVCRRNQKCHLGRCVQCASDQDCGPGTACESDSGTCYSILNRCDIDSDCPHDKRCVLSSHECVRPQCVNDWECQSEDRRNKCSLLTYTCYLPPALCSSESDEPNNTRERPTFLTGNKFSGTLCRGDTDVLAFTANPKKRYKMKFDIEHDAKGVEIAILNDRGETVQRSVLVSTDQILVANNLANEAVRYFIRLSGNGMARDQWKYTIEISESNAPQEIYCDAREGNDVEPNDSVSTAMLLDMGSEETKSFVFNRCGQNDVDYFRLPIPPQHGIEISIEFVKDYGEFELLLCKGSSCSRSWDRDVISSSRREAEDVRRVSASEGYSDVWVRVSPSEGFFQNNWDTNQSYTITAKLIARPAQCALDSGEPDNDQPARGQNLSAGAEIAGLRCLGDVDYYTIELPAGTGAVVKLQFEHREGDLRLDLLRPDGRSEDSANNSSLLEGMEQIHILPGEMERRFNVRVRLHGTNMTVAQPYRISMSSYDGQQCLLEGNITNNHVTSATVMPLPITEFQGYVCGKSDIDWYRVGKIANDRALVAELSHVPQFGVIGFELWAEDRNGRLIKKAVNSNVVGTSKVKLQYTQDEGESGMDYLFKVFASQGSDPQAQPYQLAAHTYWVCRRDRYEESTGNNIESSATVLRLVGANQHYDERVSASICAGDSDFFKILYALPSEKIDIELEGPSHLQLRVNDANGLEIQENDVLSTDGNVILRRRVNITRGQEIRFSVSAQTPILEGAYTLHVQALPAT